MLYVHITLITVRGKLWGLVLTDVAYLIGLVDSWLVLILTGLSCSLWNKVPEADLLDKDPTDGHTGRSS